MAWNEPGGGNRDPWGNKNDKGPPDLDEAFKKVQDKVTDLFGNKSGSGGGGSSAAVSWGGGIVFVICPMLWLTPFNRLFKRLAMRRCCCM